MKIFIGWSGPQSEAVGKALHGWLPKVIQAITPWISTEDIAKGTAWRDKVSGELEACDFGIICMMPHNLTSSWLLFEAGPSLRIVPIAMFVPTRTTSHKSDLPGSSPHAYNPNASSLTERYK